VAPLRFGIEPEEGGSLCTVCEAVYIGVPGVAVGLDHAREVLPLPAAAAFDVRAVAVGGGRAALSAVLTEGEALSIAMDSANATEAGQPADALLADVRALEKIELTLWHGSIYLWWRKL
jgi:hypothetical protein